MLTVEKRREIFSSLACSTSLKDMRAALIERQYAAKRALLCELGGTLTMVEAMLRDSRLLHTFDAHCLLRLIFIAPFFELAPGRHRDPESGTYVLSTLLRALPPEPADRAWDRGVFDAMVNATFSNVRAGLVADELVVNGNVHTLGEAQPLADFYRAVCDAEGCPPTDAVSVAAKLVRIARHPSSTMLMMDDVYAFEVARRQRKRILAEAALAMRDQDDIETMLAFMKKKPAF